MLVTLKEILQVTEAKKCAVGSFNTPNLESIQAVIEAAEELDVPVILMHAQPHEKLVPLDVIGPIMVQMAERSGVPVCVHLDQGKSLNYLWRALKIGFSSIMYDGSALAYEENVANTCIAVSMGRRKGASVEAEIGTLGGHEWAGQSIEDEPLKVVYTNPLDAKRFVEETGVDALSCSFGNRLGMYKTDAKLDFTVLDEVIEAVRVPLVMQGGSGISDEDYRTAIEKGIRKINYYTYMAKAGGDKVCDEVRGADGSTIYFHDVALWGRDAMKEHVMRVMKVFAMK